MLLLRYTVKPGAAARQGGFVSITIRSDTLQGTGERSSLSPVLARGERHTLSVERTRLHFGSRAGFAASEWPEKPMRSRRPGCASQESRYSNVTPSARGGMACLPFTAPSGYAQCLCGRSTLSELLPKAPPSYCYPGSIIAKGNWGGGGEWGLQLVPSAV